VQTVWSRLGSCGVPQAKQVSPANAGEKLMRRPPPRERPGCNMGFPDAGAWRRTPPTRSYIRTVRETK